MSYPEPSDSPYSCLPFRLVYYHFFAWFSAGFMALLLGGDDRLNGFYYVGSEAVSETAICWIKSKDSHTVNFRPSLFLYIPVGAAFFASVIVLGVSYSRLRQGISKTFQHRVRAFLGNFTNMVVFTLYWLVNIFLFAMVYFNRKNENIAEPSNKLLWFMISAKGFADVIVWILVSDNPIFKMRWGSSGDSAESRLTVANESSVSDGFDFNVILRQEVLYYVTTGIRNATLRASAESSASVKKLVFRMTKPLRERSKRLNSSYLFQLFFHGNLGTIQNLMVSSEVRVSVSVAQSEGTAASGGPGVRMNPLNADTVSSPVHQQALKRGSKSDASIGSPSFGGPMSIGDDMEVSVVDELSMYRGSDIAKPTPLAGLFHGMFSGGGKSHSASGASLSPEESMEQGNRSNSAAEGAVDDRCL
jgi:hypothetical protein